MLGLLNAIELKHQEYIDWLKSRKDDYEIEEFISYVIRKKNHYKDYRETFRISFIDELPRSMNRYLDEFSVDYQFKKESDTFINSMILIMGEIKVKHHT